MGVVNHTPNYFNDVTSFSPRARHSPCIVIGKPSRLKGMVHCFLLPKCAFRNLNIVHFLMWFPGDIILELLILLVAVASGVARTSPLLGHSMHGHTIYVCMNFRAKCNGVWRHPPPKNLRILQPPRSVLMNTYMYRSVSYLRQTRV